MRQEAYAALPKVTGDDMGGALPPPRITERPLPVQFRTGPREAGDTFRIDGLNDARLVPPRLQLARVEIAVVTIVGMAACWRNRREPQAG